MPTLKSLPIELLICILDFIPSVDLQQTTISLIHIHSHKSISSWRSYLFHHVHLKRAKSVPQLYEHLKRAPGDAIFIRKFSLAVWSDDVNLSVHAVQVIAMLPRLEWLSLYVGKHFPAEQLKQLFQKPIPTLRYLALLFRP
jgi:hypothetical protein